MVQSDNDTNLTAAEKKLSKIMEKIDQEKIRRRHAAIEWNFSPPRDSHMAGVCERLVRSTKLIIRALLKNKPKSYSPMKIFKRCFMRLSIS